MTTPILVIDDSLTIRKMLELSLTAAGHAVHVAATPVRELLTRLQSLRVARIGDPADAARISGEIDQAIAAVDEVEQLHGKALRSTATWESIKADWAKLRNAPEDDQALAALTGRIATDLIVNTIGNNSNLILDPDLDSYWMMDAYVIKLPLLGELVASTTRNAVAATSGAPFNNAQRAELSALTGLIRATTSDLINVDLKAALEDNERDNPSRDGNRRLRPRLEEPFKNVAASLTAFSDLVRDRVLIPEQPTLERAELRRSAAELVLAVQALQTKVGPELDRLCVERADRYRMTRFIGLLVFIFAALLISYVFNGFTSSVRASQKRIEDENERLQQDILGLLKVVSEAADGDLRARAKVGEGTLGNVADAFNQMMES